MNAHRRTRGVRLGVRSRGVTLIEIMIVLALLVGLAAIALPALIGDLDRRAYEEAVQTVTSQLLLARAHAQATGRAVEISYRPEGSFVVARFFDPARDLVRENEDEIPTRESRAAAPAGDASGAPDAVDVIHERWAFRTLGDGVTMTREPPPDPDALSGAFGFLDADRSVGAPAGDAVSSDPAPIRIAVFLPDGSTLLGEPVWISGAERRAGELSVNAWTGLPSFAPREAGAFDESGEDPAADEAEDEPDLFGEGELSEDAVGRPREPEPPAPDADEEDAP